MTSRSPVRGARSPGAREAAAPRADAETRWALPPGVLLSRPVLSVCPQSLALVRHSPSLFQAAVAMVSSPSARTRPCLRQDGSLCSVSPVEACVKLLNPVTWVLPSQLDSWSHSFRPWCPDGGNRTPRSSLAAGRHGRVRLPGSASGSGFSSGGSSPGSARHSAPVLEIRPLLGPER